MYYGFQTEREEIGVAALLVYGVYQSRDRGRFKVSLDMWGRVGSAVKNAARMSLHSYSPPIHSTCTSTTRTTRRPRTRYGSLG